jgi:multidrug efflux pump subunit AcrB
MLILSVVLVYAVMASQYESLRDPFIIMFSIPLAAIGVVRGAEAHGHDSSACRPTSASSCSAASS